MKSREQLSVGSDDFSSSKLTVLIAALLACSFIPSGTYASPSGLTPQIVLNSFPLCEIASSFGQKCKMLTAEQRAGFVPSKIQSVSHVETSGTQLILSTDDWNYSFNVVEIGDQRATLEFIDDAVFGTYFVASKYDVEWDADDQNWFLTGKTVTFIAGSPEDKKIEGERRMIKPPIPFVVSR